MAQEIEGDVYVIVFLGNQQAKAVLLQLNSKVNSSWKNMT